MFQWFYRFCIWLMEELYVRMDARIERPVDSELLGIRINLDFGSMSRQELCRHVEKRFGFKKDAIWNLQSTSKIRLACQLARNMKRGELKV